MTVNWYNYFLTSKDSRLTTGHLKASQLYNKILDHDGTTAFCCYFDLDYDCLKLEYDYQKKDSDGKKIYTYLAKNIIPEDKNHLKPKITFAQYEGIARPSLNMVSFDFDTKPALIKDGKEIKPEVTKEDVIEDVRRFVEWLGVDDIAVFFSGSKGFHVMVPFGYFPLEANQHLPNQIKDMAVELSKTFKAMDTSIYNYNRKFRVPFTAHDKTSRFKSFVPLAYLKTLTLDAIIQNAEHRSAFDFLEDIKPDAPRTPLQIFVTVMENVKRASYEIEKEKAGNLEKPSPFEKYDNKLCIKKLLESRCDDVGRNNACIRIVNDFYRIGKTKEDCEEAINKWGDKNGLPRHESSAIIANIYERGANYNFGCQDEVKSLYCSAKCSIWKKLDPDKRPVTVDQPTSEASNVKEFKLVNTMLCSTFKCGFDDFKKEFYGGNIVKQGKEDLFLYDDGVWNFLDAPGIDKIKRRLNAIADGKLTIKKIEAAYRMFMVYVPSVPEGVDMFRPNPLCANFNNGTLHLQEHIDGKFFLEFKKHNPKDWITFKIKYDYIADDTHTNKMFDDMLLRTFKDEESCSDKINAIQEMFGACLIPYFPHLFYLYGKPHSGKSSILMVLKQLLGDEKYISAVQPKDFVGFNLEAMAGKLVNMVLDVDTKKPMQDDVVKQIEDRMPITIRRKNRTDIVAPLPSVHIFGGNDLIPSYEGYSGAMKRRWTIFRFNHIFGGDRSRNFAGRVFKSDPQGLVNFAIAGLNKLVEQQGYFSTFDSSTKELEEWGEESDVVVQFIDEGLRGESSAALIKNDTVKIERKILYDMFSEWQDASGYKYSGMTKVQFYKRVKSMGYEVVGSNGVRYFAKLGELTAKNPASNSGKKNNDNI